MMNTYKQKMKPRYRQSRANDDKVREQSILGEKPYFQVYYENDSDRAPIIKQIKDLANFYIKGQNKYGGEDLHDFLDQNVANFHDYYEKIGFLRSQYHWAFSIMLKDRAADYYYKLIVGNAISMTRMI